VNDKFCTFAKIIAPMPIFEITDTSDVALDPYIRLTETELRQSKENDLGLFIAESPKVIRVALDRGYIPISILCERKHITGDASDIVARCPETPVYTADRDILASITGYTLTRGVLCAMKRPPLPSLRDICDHARLVAVIQSVTDTTNIGAIFRSAAALGVDAVILSSDACDPLNRRAVRVSMGTVFAIPWTVCCNPISDLKQIGFMTSALALCDESISLDDKRLKEIPRLAVIFGTEGDGLPKSIIAQADYVVRIPMHHGVDSLNVASAAAITFWELRH